MNVRVLAVANQKGGVGKTTTALTLAAAFAKEGRSVLVMDLDPHVSASIHMRFYPEKLRHTAYDLFTKPKSERWHTAWNRVTYPAAGGIFDFVPAHTKLSDLDVDLAGVKGKGSLLVRALINVPQDYDYVILDSPPYLGVLLANAIMAANLVIIPIQTEYLALNGLKLIFSTMRTLNRVRREPVGYRALATMFDSRASACKRVLSLLRDKLGDRMFETIIHHDTKLREASGKGAVIYDLYPESRSALEYLQLAAEIETL